MTLSKFAKQLDDARRDVARLQQLQDAENRVQALSALYAEAKADADREAAESAAAAHEARMDGITDITITAGYDPQVGDHLLSTRFDITYNRPAYNFRTGVSAPMRFAVVGFAAVPDEVMLYLIEKQPDRIPAAIMALAPGDARQAFGRYFVAMRRGHL